MWVDHLQGWLTATTLERDPDTSKWRRVMELVYISFMDVTLPTGCMWKLIFILPKVNGEYREILLIGFLWKTVLVVINHPI